MVALMLRMASFSRTPLPPGIALRIAGALVPRASSTPRDVLDSAGVVQGQLADHIPCTWYALLGNWAAASTFALLKCTSQDGLAGHLRPASFGSDLPRNLGSSLRLQSGPAGEPS